MACFVNVTEIGKNWEKNEIIRPEKNTAGHKLIPTRCKVALDYKLSLACQTLLGSGGFLSCFGFKNEAKIHNKDRT